MDKLADPGAILWAGFVELPELRLDGCTATLLRAQAMHYAIS